MKFRKYLMAFSIVLSASLISSAAMAQDEFEPGNPFAALAGGGILSTTSSSILASPLTTTGGIILTVVKASQPQKGQALHLYLKSNQDTVIESVSLGSGDAVTDLAALYEVPESGLADFGVQLRARRALLVELVSDVDVSETQAERFGAIIEEILSSGEV